MAASFGALLEKHRKRRGLTLSAVAKAIGVSLVYYRDVELGKRRAFSTVSVNFDKLGKLLDIDGQKLHLAAAAERGQLEFDFQSAGREERIFAVLVAQSLANKRMTKATRRRIVRILEKVS